jgi:cytochrome P450
MIHSTNAIAGGLGTLPWLLQTTKLVPRSLNPLMKIIAYSSECVEDRKKRKPEEPDVLSHILEAGPFFHDELKDRLLLNGDARLLIIAGSDTTATTLTYAFYNFARDPSIVQKLRAELEENHVSSTSSINVMDLQNLPFLNAVIYETLRLHPPVPGGVYRLTPKDGVMMAGKHLPGGVKIVGPHFTIQRCTQSP